MRINYSKINRRILEKLIMSGSCDCFSNNRNYLLALIDDAIKSSRESFKIKCSKQENLFGFFNNELHQVKKNIFIKLTHSNTNKLSNEYQALGLYLTEHPIDQYSKELNKYTCGLTLSKLKFIKTRKKVFVAGIIVSIKLKRTKNKNRIAVLVLDDNTNRIEVVLFTVLLNAYESYLKLHTLLFVKGILSLGFSNKYLKITAYEILDLNTVRKNYANI